MRDQRRLRVLSSASAIAVFDSFGVFELAVDQLPDCIAGMREVAAAGPDSWCPNIGCGGDNFVCESTNLCAQNGACVHNLKC